MLCQLSYRGTALGRANCSRGLGEFSDRARTSQGPAAGRSSARRGLDSSRWRCRSRSAAKLLAVSSSIPSRVGTRIELGDQGAARRRRPLVDRCAPRGGSSSPSKCSGHLGEDRPSSGWAAHAREGLALEPVAASISLGETARRPSCAARRAELRRSGRAGRSPAATPRAARATPAMQFEARPATRRYACCGRARGRARGERDGPRYASASASRASKPPGSSAGSFLFGSETTRISKPAQCELHAAKRRLLVRPRRSRSRGRRAASAARAPQLLLGKRGSHRRDDRLEPGLPQRDHVGVPLDDDRPILLRDRRASEVQPVEDADLWKGRLPAS